MPQSYFHELLQNVLLQQIQFVLRHFIDDARLNELMKVHIVLLDTILHQQIDHDNAEFVAGLFDFFEFGEKSKHIIIVFVQDFTCNKIDAIIGLYVANTSDPLLQCTSIRVLLIL